jgi:hypothetical protein
VRKVSIAISLPYESWNQIRGLNAAGLAARVSDQAEAARVSRLLLAKTPESAAFAPYGMSGVAFFNIVPKVITLLDYSKRIGHSATLVVGT